MHRSSYRRILPLTLAVIGGLVLLVAACGATPTATLVPPTPTRVPAPPTATQPTAAPTATTAPAAPQPTATTATMTISFAKDVLPIFQKSCTRCHGANGPRAGLSLTTYEAILKGGNNPPAVVAGDPEKSPVYTLVKSGVMPFGGPKLSDADAQKIFDWIKAGAPNN